MRKAGLRADVVSFLSKQKPDATFFQGENTTVLQFYSDDRKEREEEGRHENMVYPPGFPDLFSHFLSTSRLVFLQSCLIRGRARVLRLMVGGGG